MGSNSILIFVLCHNVLRCPADLLHHFLVVAAVALVRRRATAVAVPRGFDVVAVEGAAAGGDPREEDEEGHNVDVPEPLEAQEDGAAMGERENWNR